MQNLRRGHYELAVDVPQATRIAAVIPASRRTRCSRSAAPAVVPDPFPVDVEFPATAASSPRCPDHHDRSPTTTSCDRARVMATFQRLVCCTSQPRVCSLMPRAPTGETTMMSRSLPSRTVAATGWACAEPACVRASSWELAHAGPMAQRKP